MAVECYRIQLVDAAGTVTFETNVAKHNLIATVAPTVSNDDSQGYAPTSMWADRTADKVYICADNATGAAVWKEVPVSGVGLYSADGTSLTLTGTVFSRNALTGDVTAGAGASATTIAANAVTDAKLRDSAGLSAIGRSANTTGDPADLVAANDGEVLRRSGTTLGFGTVATAGIAAQAVTNAKLASMADQTVKANLSGVTASPQDVSFQNLFQTVGGSLRGNLMVMGAVNYQALTLGASGTFLKSDGTDAVWGTGPVPLVPGGRLTLTTGVPVTVADVTGATIFKYTPFAGDQIGLWNGSAWVAYTFAELTLTPTLTASKVYDVFCFQSAGTPTLEVLVWTNDTTRATAVTLQDGRYCKSGDKTRLLLGSVYSNASSQLTDSFLLRGVYNAYHRRRRPMRANEVTDSWAYSTASWRALNNSTANAVQYVAGLDEDAVRADVGAWCSSSGAGNPRIGVGVDSTTVNAAQINPHVGAAGGQRDAVYEGHPGVGFHTLYAIERGGTGVTINGDGGVADANAGIVASVMG